MFNVKWWNKKISIYFFFQRKKEIAIKKRGSNMIGKKNPKEDEIIKKFNLKNYVK
jgi:hypothetical protein